MSLRSSSNHRSARSTPREPRTPRGRRTWLLVSLFCLSIVTGAALLGAGVTMTEARITHPPSRLTSANADLVRAFYAAINHALATGDLDDVRSVIVDDAVWCADCADLAPGRDALETYLTDLHRTAPNARVIVESVIASDDGSAAAWTRVTGFPLARSAVSWGPVDRFAIREGSIVSRANAQRDLALVASLARDRFDRLPPAVTGIALARLTFPPGAGTEDLLSAGPTLVMIESGSLTIRAASGGVRRAGGNHGPAREADTDREQVAVLEQGDSAVVPAGVRFALEQRGPDITIVLGATLYFPGDDRAPESHPVEARLFSPIDRPAVDTPRSLPTVRVLARGVAPAWPSGPVNLVISRAVLDAGATLAVNAGETALVAVDAGQVDATGFDDARQHAVTAGGSLTNLSGSGGLVRNAGPGLVDLVLLTVSPDSMGGD